MRCLHPADNPLIPNFVYTLLAYQDGGIFIVGYGL
jgi:hypothetical protein